MPWYVISHHQRYGFDDLPLPGAILLPLESVRPRNMTLSESSMSTSAMPASAEPDVPTGNFDVISNADAHHPSCEYPCLCKSPTAANPPVNPAVILHPVLQKILKLQLLRDLAITHVLVDGNVHFQKTYNDFNFDVPQVRAAGPFRIW
jgi:hypothetical protein